MAGYRFNHRALEQARVARGLRPEHVAVAIHRGKEQVSAYERGRARPPLPVLLDLCRVLDLTLDEVLVPEETPDETAAAHARETARAQGLPDTVEDPATLDAVAEILAG